MFIGHFALGLAARKITRKPSLGTLFIAAQFVDLLWPVLLLLGWEVVKVEPGNTVFTPLNFIHYPISHSLLMTLVWGIIIGGIYYGLRQDKQGALWLGALVVSHWALDFITHRPDLPLYPGGPQAGLGLWNSLAGTILVEGSIFAAGIYFYLSSTEAKNKTGVYSFWGLVVFLTAIYLNNIWAPPPPDSANIIAAVGLAQWLLVAWGYWIDRNRAAA